MRDTETTPGSLAERRHLQNRKIELEDQIRLNSCDLVAVAKIREEYRQVCDKLETFYDDIKEGEVTNE